MLRTLLLSLLLLGLEAQRSRHFEDEEDEHGNSLTRPTSDVGDFPYQRGERPIFNFDQGDEGFIATIPELIEGLDKIKNVMNQQRKITSNPLKVPRRLFEDSFQHASQCSRTALKK